MLRVVTGERVHTPPSHEIQYDDLRLWTFPLRVPCYLFILIVYCFIFSILYCFIFDLYSFYFSSVSTVQQELVNVNISVWSSHLHQSLAGAVGLRWIQGGAQPSFRFISLTTGWMSPANTHLCTNKNRIVQRQTCSTSQTHNHLTLNGHVVFLCVPVCVYILRICSFMTSLPPFLNTRRHRQHKHTNYEHLYEISDCRLAHVPPAIREGAQVHDLQAATRGRSSGFTFRWAVGG